jgi:zinc/manganese transport system substrate-binding protein
MRHLTILFLSLAAGSAHAALKVVTTTTDLRAIAAQVGGDFVSVESVAKGTQDPHYVEAKPSFMVKISRADLVIAIGLDLEIGWLPSIINGARNPKVGQGQKGYLEVGPLVAPLEIPHGSITRAEGDVHPLGNPHVTLDPIRDGEIAIYIAKRLSELDSKNASRYLENAKRFQTRLASLTDIWKKRIEKSGVRRAVTYHKTLTYFFERFHLQSTAILEPKPGIPPTSSHILEVIQLMKDQGTSLVLVENYFDSSVTKKIKQSLPVARVVTVPVAVDGEVGVGGLEELFEHLVQAVEGRHGG